MVNERDPRGLGDYSPRDGNMAALTNRLRLRNWLFGTKAGLRALGAVALLTLAAFLWRAMG